MFQTKPLHYFALLATLPLFLLTACDENTENNEVNKNLKTHRLEFENGSIIQMTHDDKNNFNFEANENEFKLYLGDKELAQGTLVEYEIETPTNNCHWEESLTDTPMLYCSKSIDNHDALILFSSTEKENEELIEQSLEAINVEMINWVSPMEEAMNDMDNALNHINDQWDEALGDEDRNITTENGWTEYKHEKE